MRAEEIICPICESSGVEVSKHKRVYSLPYASPFSIDFEEDHCPTCGESGDFYKRNDGEFEKAEKAARLESINNMLEDLGRHGITMAYIERVLDLPKRTIARWKSGSDSATGVALLRMVRTCPWMLEIAKNRFSPSITAKVVLNQAGNFLASYVSDIDDLTYNPFLQTADTRINVFVHVESPSLGEIADTPMLLNDVAFGTGTR